MVNIIKIVLLVAAWCPVILNLPGRHPGLLPHVDPKAVADCLLRTLAEAIRFL